MGGLFMRDRLITGITGLDIARRLRDIGRMGRIIRAIVLLLTEVAVRRIRVMVEGRPGTGMAMSGLDRQGTGMVVAPDRLGTGMGVGLGRLGMEMVVELGRRGMEMVVELGHRVMEGEPLREGLDLRVMGAGLDRLGTEAAADRRLLLGQLHL